MCANHSQLYHFAVKLILGVSKDFPYIINELNKMKISVKNLYFLEK